MIRRYVLAALVLSVIAIDAQAAPSAASMYASARAREDALRSAWTSGKQPQPTLAQVRAVIAAYRSIVSRYPRSGYSDNALYQAAGLASEAYSRFGSTREHGLAVELLKTLIREYPSSSLIPSARILIGDLEASVEAAKPRAAPSAKIATITGIERTPLPGGTRVTVNLDGPASYVSEQLDGPPRLVLDFASTKTTDSLRFATLTYDDDLVRAVRVGHHANSVTRVVLDLAENVTLVASASESPARVVIDCKMSSAQPKPGPAEPAAGTTSLPSSSSSASSADGPGSSAAAPGSGTVVSKPGSAGPGSTGPGSTAAGSASTAAAPASNAAASGSSGGAGAGTPPPEAPSEPLPSQPNPAVIERAPRGPTGTKGTGLSMAKQLGLAVARIVIDPGHGGHDPGAKTRNTTEAQVVLDIALRLEKLLLEQPGIEVVMTRRTDVYVPLEERTAIANRERADLFLSIHANASRRTAANGIETYILDFASNADAAEVAARENQLSGIPISNLPEIVRAITLTSKLDESRAFAGQVQQSMVNHVRKVNAAARDLGVKRAPFVVLIGATMPSVLVEVSFLTHPREGQLLSSANYRQRIAEALLEGIMRYRRALSGEVVVASQ